MLDGEQGRGQGGRRVLQCGRSLLVGGCLFISACAATDEAIQKSQGHYQEGIATLSGDRQKAFVSFQKAVQLNPKNKEAHYGLGHVYAIQGKFTLAEEQFLAAIQIDDAYSEAHTYLGQVLASQGKWEEAIRSYRAALANPLYATPDLARFHLGRALIQQGDFQEAMESLEDAATANPASVPPALTLLELGRVYTKLGYTAKAREALGKVKTMDKGGEYAAAATELLARLK
ncbi:tetratricopeptide repeat protein [Nitrospira lenta]|uniref:Putative Type IV pilus biogenesis/stability protein PilW n=1 Tax=Nitrospira lenta TaxID=1436998 RepID=A0A330L975_9BACT|nr:tetratricopeptide repeat protein [Nitrospira lenta]SPP65819.1 putative Type IV pilus biogenesis/stability protein PilW [Nitrospira lenta]